MRLTKTQIEALSFLAKYDRPVCVFGNTDSSSRATAGRWRVSLRALNLRAPSLVKISRHPWGAEDIERFKITEAGRAALAKAKGEQADA